MYLYIWVYVLYVHIEIVLFIEEEKKICLKDNVFLWKDTFLS